MIVDVPPVIDRLPAIRFNRIWKAIVRWVPGLKEDAPRRNVLILIAYLELLVIVVSLLRHFF